MIFQGNVSTTRPSNITFTPRKLNLSNSTLIAPMSPSRMGYFTPTASNLQGQKIQFFSPSSNRKNISYSLPPRQLSARNYSNVPPQVQQIASHRNPNVLANPFLKQQSNTANLKPQFNTKTNYVRNDRANENTKVIQYEQQLKKEVVDHLKQILKQKDTEMEEAKKGFKEVIAKLINEIQPEVTDLKKVLATKDLEIQKLKTEILLLKKNK